MAYILLYGHMDSSSCMAIWPYAYAYAYGPAGHVGHAWPGENHVQGVPWHSGMAVEFENKPKFNSWVERRKLVKCVPRHIIIYDH